MPSNSVGFVEQPTSKILIILKNSSILVGIAVSLTAIYSAGFGIFKQNAHNSLAMMASLFIVFATTPLVELYKIQRRAISLLFWMVDAVLATSAILGTFHYMTVQNKLNDGFYDLSNWDIALGYAGMIALIEFCRRAWGLPLVLATLYDDKSSFDTQLLPFAPKILCCEKWF